MALESCRAFERRRGIFLDAGLATFIAGAVVLAEIVLPGVRTARRLNVRPAAISDDLERGAQR